MEIDKYYGFYFIGENFNSKLSQTYLPVDQLELEHLLSEAESYSHDVEFKVLMGLVKELTLGNGKICVESPSKVGGKKFQAFIFKRRGDLITNKQYIYYLNGKSFEHSFSQYNVSIIEVDD